MLCVSVAARRAALTRRPLPGRSHQPACRSTRHKGSRPYTNNAQGPPLRPANVRDAAYGLQGLCQTTAGLQTPGTDVDHHQRTRKRVVACSAASAVAEIMPDGGRALFRALWKYLKKLPRFVRCALRALALVAGWLPIATAGGAVWTLERLRLCPPFLHHLWWGVVLRAVEASGPAYIKLMQWASTRRDLFPEAFCQRFSKLHAAARPHPWKKTAAALDRAFGDRWRGVLELDTQNPIGSGCVAQVYRARLHGRDVAVKVVHPQVKRQIEMDMDIMRGVAHLLEMLPSVRWLSVGESVEEFSNLMGSQLDMRIEGDNLRRFQRNFRDSKEVRFPTPVDGWVSENVLVESLEEGEPISHYLNQTDAFTRKLARVGLDSFLKMVFLDNFMHGDLHPGNMLVSQRKDGKGPCLTLLDVGIVTELGPEDRRNFVDLFYAIVKGEGRHAGELMIERARDHRCSDPEGFCNEIDSIVQTARGHDLRLSRVHVGELLGRVLSCCCKYEVKLESRFASVIIAIAVLEGVGRSLDPDINILKAALPVLVKANFARG